MGYAGLKDRHATTRQWFSVLRKAGGAAWAGFDCEGAEVLDIGRHSRKLNRGAHAGNRFRIALRSSDVSSCLTAIDDRLGLVSTSGVPNYFGVQRFGRDASNLDLAKRLFAGARLRRDKRSIAISAARSLLFNEILAARVKAGTWNSVLPGEIVSLDGSNSVFGVSEPDDEIERRCSEMDVHPSGSLYGTGGKEPSGDVAAIEREVVGAYRELAEGLDRLGVKRAQRPLRLRVFELGWEQVDDVLWLTFYLRKGGFATTVLDEIASIQTSPSNT